MKNIILGVLGCLIAVYTIVSCLSIYSISTRKNEMENSISQVLEQTMKTYYLQQTGDAQVKESVREEILGQLHSASEVSIDIRACDMTQGILSVCVEEKFTIPGGIKKVISCDKTIIVDGKEE